MSKYDRLALPVVDSRGVLVGIVTADDVADVAEQQATETIQKLGGMEALDEPYSTITMWSLLKKRGGWLAALFIGELLTASVMQYFNKEIDRAAVVALFLPLIISSGGNSGSQASTLIIRAMALGEITLKQWWWVLRRELTVGLILGLFLGVIGFIRIHLWQWIHFYDYNSNKAHAKEGDVIYDIAGLYHKIGLTVGIALIGVVLWGTICGGHAPLRPPQAPPGPGNDLRAAGRNTRGRHGPDHLLPDRNVPPPRHVAIGSRSSQQAEGLIVNSRGWSERQRVTPPDRHAHLPHPGGVLVAAKLKKGTGSRRGLYCFAIS